MHKHKGMLFKTKMKKGMFSRHQVWNYSKEENGISSYKHKDTISHNNFI